LDGTGERHRLNVLAHRLIQPGEIADAICVMLANCAVSGELGVDANWHAPA